MKRWFQQIVSIISQFNSNKQSWFSKAAVHKSLHSALKNFAKFKWKHLHWSHLINSLQTCYCIKKRLHCEQQVFSCIFCKMLKNPVLFIFFQKTSWWLLLVFSFIFYWFLPPSKILDTRFFLFLNVFSQLLMVINVINFVFGKLLSFVRNKKLTCGCMGPHIFLRHPMEFRSNLNLSLNKSKIKLRRQSPWSDL